VTGSGLGKDSGLGTGSGLGTDSGLGTGSLLGTGSGFALIYVILVHSVIDIVRQNIYLLFIGFFLFLFISAFFVK